MTGPEDPSLSTVARWARDPLEAVARIVSNSSREDPNPEPYFKVLGELLEWWRDSIEASGDWDVFGAPLAAAIEDAFDRREIAHLVDVECPQCGGTRVHEFPTPPDGTRGRCPACEFEGWMSDFEPGDIHNLEE